MRIGALLTRTGGWSTEESTRGWERVLHDAGLLDFFGTMAHLTERRAFLRHLAPGRGKRWVVYAKTPFVGPEAVLAYLSGYTHRSRSRTAG